MDRIPTSSVSLASSDTIFSVFCHERVYIRIENVTPYVRGMPQVSP